jgi:hypothetical protein
MVDALNWDALLRQEPPRVVPAPLRAVALRGERRWQWSLVLGAIICVPFVAAFFPWLIVDDIRLDLGGMAGRGVVVESEYAKRTIGDDSTLSKRLVFQVRFRFDDLQAREHEASSLFFRYLEPRAEVDVEFLPSDPTVARVKDGFFVPGGLWEVLWSAMFIALPLIAVWNYRRWRKGRLALLIHGEQVPGYIERVWRDQPEDDTRGWIEVSYPARDGPFRLSQAVEGEIYRRACAIVEGQLPVRVLHAPQAPREHVVLELMH